jgi:hypothetical protein
MKRKTKNTSADEICLAIYMSSSDAMCILHGAGIGCNRLLFDLGIAAD